MLGLALVCQSANWIPAFAGMTTDEDPLEVTFLLSNNATDARHRARNPERISADG